MGEITGETDQQRNVRSRDDVRAILENWRDFEWQVQGFGMLRTYLDGPGEPRLQVWDQRLACWGNNAIHDHPWGFESTTYAGVLFNQRFDVVGMQRGMVGDGHITEIKPGTRGGKLSERPISPCRIQALPLEVYSLGDRYSQHHREMHLTRYEQGTVTLITRHDREEADVARVAWFGAADAQPPFVNPYPAVPKVAERIITDCLRTWWLPLPWWEDRPTTTERAPAPDGEPATGVQSGSTDPRSPVAKRNPREHGAQPTPESGNQIPPGER